MTTREYLDEAALRAMAALLAEDGTLASNNGQPLLAKLSYDIAYAMLHERSKRIPDEVK